MRIAVTGTPGTGKTTATTALETELAVVHLNDHLRTDERLVANHDTDRDSRVVDLDALRNRFAGDDDLLVESHLAHYLPADRVIVLRAHPRTIEKRLRERGESQQTATENAESEALDVILTEAVDRHGMDHVYEIETTDQTPAETAAAIAAVIAGDRTPTPGTVSYLEYLDP